MKPVIKGIGSFGRCSVQGICIKTQPMWLVKLVSYIQSIWYFGPTEVCDQATKTLQLEQAK